ncbi:MAG: AhpC/TSA family protein [Prevotellaceae bacterium]|jgi:thiol-disulfide isomerase/thioredoxin|nr:AhpC/TSA family protein [Prevotellaceae bacterium]
MKQISFLLVTLGIMLTFAACDRSTITAHIKNLGNDTVYVEYIPLTDYYARNMNTLVRDTVVAVNDKFTYTISGNDDVVIEFTTARAGQAITFPAVNHADRIKIAGAIEDSDLSYTATGTVVVEAQSQQELVNKPLIVQIDSLENLYKVIMGSMTPDDSAINNIREAYKNLILEKQANDLTYIKSNPASDYSGYLLTRQPIDTFNVYYEKLADNVKTGTFKEPLELCAKRYDDYLQRKLNEENVKPGAAAPVFTLKNLDGKDVCLTDIQGKYIVLDFWGSWCSWCVRGYPRMKEYYAKYKKKVEFVGIACNDNDEDWRNAVQKNELQWTQLFHPKEDNVPIRYAVKGFPTKVILDSEYKIVGVFEGESDEFYEKLDKLFK